MTPTATLRVDSDVRDRIRKLAAARGVRASARLRQLVGEAEDAQLLAEMNADFERMNQDPAARGRYDAELRE